MNQGILHAANGEVKVKNFVFLPQLTDAYTEYEIDSNEINIEENINIGKRYISIKPQEGEYTKITAMVKVTRYFLSK